MKYLPLLLMLFLFSCDNQTSNESMRSEIMAEDAPMKDGAQPIPAAERKVIRNGYMRVETDDIEATATKIKAVIKELDGYITNESTNDYDRTIQQNLTLRVPEKNFDQLVAAVASISKKVSDKNIFSQDVTREYIDLEARLKNLKALEDRYLELLKQANNMENIIAIEKQLSEVRIQIESLTTQLRHMQNQVQYSTLEVSIYSKTSRASNFLTKAGDALDDGWEVFIGFLLVMMMLWPFWVIIIIIIITVKWWKKRRKT